MHVEFSSSSERAGEMTRKSTEMSISRSNWTEDTKKNLFSAQADSQMFIERDEMLCMKDFIYLLRNQLCIQFNKRINAVSNYLHFGIGSDIQPIE